MKKNKFMVLGMSAIALALILAFAGCVTVPSGVDAAEAAAQLAAEFNAIIPGIAEVDGVTVTLTNRIWFQWSGEGDAIFMDGRREVSEGLWIKSFSLTVPAGVTLDVTADDAGLYLGNMTLTVDGTVNARGNGGLGFEDNTSEAIVNGSGTINLTGKGSLFIDNGKKLILDGVTLVGVADNDESLVWVGEGGEFILKSGAITGNSGAGAGGGVGVEGTFTMEGGEISGNNVMYAGGVYVMAAGTFTMTGGIISGNTAQEESGGVRLDGGTFIMTGGEISGNISIGVEEEWSGGGGVDLRDEASFTMSGGIISGNSAGNSTGGGVKVTEGCTFTMTGGEISGNTAGGGGGVVIYDGTFTMTGGEISGNTAGGSGGGVSMAWGATFTMEGGEISGNRVQGGDKGGGVFVGWESTFNMYGGAIYGNSVQGSEMAFGGGVMLDGATSFTMFGGRIQGGTESDGYAANAVTASIASGAALNVGEPTARWGTGGTYTRGGEPQTGGSIILAQYGTDDTLIAIPAP